MLVLPSTLFMLLLSTPLSMMLLLSMPLLPLPPLPLLLLSLPCRRLQFWFATEL